MSLNLTERMRYYSNILLREDIMSGEDDEAKSIHTRMVHRATERLIKSGKTAEEAKAIVLAAFSSPLGFDLPTLEDLDG